MPKPYISQVRALPSSGDEGVGKTITLTVSFSHRVFVNGTPTLSLNDGGTATYSGGSGTSALTFSYTVGATNSSVAALAVTGANLKAGAPAGGTGVTPPTCRARRRRCRACRSTPRRRR